MVVKYFLSKSGTPTRRIAGATGQGHYDIARLILNDLGQPPKPETDVYQQMERFNFVRVVEDGDKNTVWVDKARELSSAQRRFLAAKAKDGWTVSINDGAFVESRQVSPAVRALASE
jgi:hypothetical protein